MEKTEITRIIEQVNDYRFKLMRRDNIKWHLDNDIAGGWLALAETRKKMLNEAQADLDAVEKSTLELIEKMKQRFALNPKDKALRLISLHIDLINDMEPKELQKLRQKINSLRPKVLGTMDEMEQIRQQNSLFD